MKEKEAPIFEEVFEEEAPATKQNWAGGCFMLLVYVGFAAFIIYTVLNVL